MMLTRTSKPPHLIVLRRGPKGLPATGTLVTSPAAGSRMDPDSDLASVANLMRSAAAVMDCFPWDYVPPPAPILDLGEEGGLAGASIQGMLSDPAVQTWLGDHVSSWPEEFLPVFLNASSVIAQVLAVFGVD